jgi:hypothetical protein
VRTYKEVNYAPLYRNIQDVTQMSQTGSSKVRNLSQLADMLNEFETIADVDGEELEG